MDKAIKDQLIQRFSAPRTDGQRRIIFWKTRELILADELQELSNELPEVKVWVLEQTNTFATKKLLEHDDTGSDYLICDPLPAGDPNDDWLLNIRLYSEEFFADTASLRMCEMGLEGTGTQRSLVNTYAKFLNSAERRRKLAEYIKHHRPCRSEEAFTLGMMSCLCALPPDLSAEKTEAAVVASVFSKRRHRATPEGAEQDPLRVGYNLTFADFAVYDLWRPFLSLLKKNTGYAAEAAHEGDVRLQEAAIHLLLNAAAYSLPERALSACSGLSDTAQGARCYALAEAWQKQAETDFAETALRVQEALHLPGILGALSPEELLNGRFFPCIDALLVQKLTEALRDRTMGAEAVLGLISVRRTVADSEVVSAFYEVLALAAQMQLLFKETADSFHYTDAVALWNAYAERYCRMDTLYRRFHVAMAVCRRSGHELYNVTESLEAAVDLLYANGFLSKLCENWTAVSAPALGSVGHVEGLPLQNSFYEEHVATADSRMVVIISDALRYEVAAELSGRLSREMQGEVTLAPMQAVFPTSTKFGMAALLPHRHITWSKEGAESVCVKADGVSTDGLAARDALLKARHPSSIAVLAKDLLKATKDQKRAMVSGHDVVYIYHDVIDAAGHHDEESIFEACATAQEELLRLVKTVVHDLSATRLCITADHGFVYVNQPLTEADKVSLPKAGKREVKSRYALMNEGTSVEALLPVAVGMEGVAAYTPRELRRIPKQGDSARYVHGGASLQEMMVPLLSYHHHRNQTKAMMEDAARFTTKDVEIELLAEHYRISNAVFRLNFYQQEAVGPTRRAVAYKVYFVSKNGSPISDVGLIHADNTQADVNNRRFAVTFHLKPLSYDAHETYYLVAENSVTGRIAKRYEFSISLPYSFDDL